MAPLNNLLDKIKEARSLASDNALAGLLHVSRQRVSAWRHGTNHPDAVACARIADLAGVPLAQVLGVVGEARALSKDEKAVWRRLAVAALLAIVSMPGMASTSQNPASTAYYVRLRRLLARFLTGSQARTERIDHAHLLAMPG